jgi:hypothetical protein
MIMEVSVRVPKSGGSPFTTFRDRLFAGLDFLHLHGEDPTIAFLPKDSADSKNKPAMLSIADFPAVQCTMKRHYFAFHSMFAFSAVNQEKGRRITFSTRMGFNSDPDLFLDEMAGDLEERHCSFKRKTQQAMDVDNAVVLWGAPQFMCPRDAKAIIDSHLIPLEKEMMKEDPQCFPAAVHNQPWPSYELVLEQPADFDRTAPGEKYVPKPPRRRAVHIKCAKTDVHRLVVLVAAAKSKRVWLDEFGKCFPSEIMTKKMWEEDEEGYENVLNHHMAAMYSYSKAYVPGLLQAREEFKVTCLPDASGVVTTHTVSIRSILQDVELGGKKVFQCVLRSDGNRRYQVYYKAKCPITEAFVKEYLRCAAAQVYYYLLKRGVKRTEADRVVKRSFSHDQLALVKSAKYNKATKLAQVAIAEEDMDIVMAAQQSGSFIDKLAHLTEEEIVKWKAKQTLLLKEAAVTDPAAYDFDNGQDVTSIHAGKNHPKFGSGASIGASLYSVVTEAVPTLQLDDDDVAEEVNTTGQVQVTFAMQRDDGTEDEVLNLPEHRPSEHEEEEEVEVVIIDGNEDEEMEDADDDDDEEEGEDEDDDFENTLACQLWMKAPGDLRLIEQLLDQLEIELYEYEELVEVSEGISAQITDNMRSALHAEAAEAQMTMFDYIHSLRTALFQTHGKSAEDEDDEDAIDYSETEDALDPSFHLQDTDYVEENDSTLRLPGQGVGQEQRCDSTDFTGLPQGSDSSTPLGGHILPSLADPSAMGAGTATAQPGVLPG